MAPKPLPPADKPTVLDALLASPAPAPAPPAQEHGRCINCGGTEMAPELMRMIGDGNIGPFCSECWAYVPPAQASPSREQVEALQPPANHGPDQTRHHWESFIDGYELAQADVLALYAPPAAADQEQP